MADKRRVECDFDMFSHTVAGSRSTPTRNYAFYVSGGNDNYCGYSNSEIDRLVAEQAQEFDESKRWQSIRKIQEILLDDLPSVPFPGRAPIQAWHAYVHNYRNFGSAAAYVWHPNAELIWVDRR